MPIYFEDVFNDGFQSGVVFKKALNSAASTATTAGGAVGLNIGPSTGPNIYFGSGVPTVSAPQGSVYFRTDGSSTSTRMYVNTNGTTGWTNFTSAT